MKSINPEISKYKWNEDVSIRLKLGLKLSGYRYYFDHEYQGVYAYYWTSTDSDTYGSSVGFSDTMVGTSIRSNPEFGLLVRCLKN